MPAVGEFVREQAILDALRTSGRVQVNDLANEFGVSAVTVRKDLGSMERRGVLRRVRGGAVGVEASDEGTFDMRLRYSVLRKQAIARAVAPLVSNGDVIALDSSTTSYYVGQELLTRRNLVVITNGLRLAMLLMQESSARVLVPGGVVRRSAGSLVSPSGGALAGRGRIAKGFFGVVGLSTTHGLMDISAEEAQTKRFMADACEEVFGVFDASKAGGFGLHTFVERSRISGLFTDDGIDTAFRSEWVSAGVSVNVVSTAAVPAWGSGRGSVITQDAATGRRVRQS
jgi:DeoR/GlpR family transcriptional regulator of sugar metabolism